VGTRLLWNGSAKPWQVESLTSDRRQSVCHRRMGRQEYLWRLVSWEGEGRKLKPLPFNPFFPL
jgi:hypothetical protein